MPADAPIASMVHMFNSEVDGNIVEWTSTDHAATFTGPVPVTGGLNREAALTLGIRPLVDSETRHQRFFYETATWNGATQSLGSSGPAQFPLTQLWEDASNDGGRSWRNALVLDLAAARGVRQHPGPAWVALLVRCRSSTPRACTSS